MGLFGPSISKMKNNGDVDGLIHALESDKPAVCEKACLALASINSDRAINALLFMIADNATWYGKYLEDGNNLSDEDISKEMLTNNEVAMHNAKRLFGEEALRSLGGEAAFIAVENEINREDIDNYARNNFLMTLGLIIKDEDWSDRSKLEQARESACETLRKCLKDDDAKTKMAVVCGLTFCDAKTTVKDLLMVLNDEEFLHSSLSRRDSAVRNNLIYIALDAIGRRVTCCDEDCLSILEQFLSYDSETVRSMAMKVTAVTKISLINRATYQEKNPEALQSSISQLEAFLAHSNDHVQKYAANVIAQKKQDLETLRKEM